MTSSYVAHFRHKASGIFVKISSYNGPTINRRQAIAWNNAISLMISPIGPKFNAFWINMGKKSLTQNVSKFRRSGWNFQLDKISVYSPSQRVNCDNPNHADFTLCGILYTWYDMHIFSLCFIIVVILSVLGWPLWFIHTYLPGLFGWRLQLWLPAWWALWLPWWPPAGCNNALMYLLIFTINFCYCFIVVFCWK